jgi:hypothetical protein
MYRSSARDLLSCEDISTGSPGRPEARSRGIFYEQHCFARQDRNLFIHTKELFRMQDWVGISRARMLPPKSC